LRFSNGTGLLGFGGYTLELQTDDAQNASFEWLPALAAHGDQNSMADLLPSLDIELHAVPFDTSSQARIRTQGSMTFRAWTQDVSLFLLRTALALAPPGASCFVPEEQLAYSSIRVSSIVYATADLAFKGDWLGAVQEFSQVADEFFTRAGEALREVGLECAGDALKGIAKKPVLIAKIGFAYITWVPVAIYDYFKYQGRPAYITFEYSATSFKPLTPMPIATQIPSPAPTQGPDEGKIAYVGWPDQNIWLMNSDGSGKKQIIADARAEGELTWSPDGSKIAFIQNCSRPGGSTCSHVVVANADGTGRFDLTPTVSERGSPPLDSWVSWSPDGTKIAYSTTGQIYLVNPDGSNRKFLVQGVQPEWSPDGTKIAYERVAAGIYVANADGSNPVRLTGGDEGDPDWSPDGNKIAYASGAAIYVMKADGSNKVLLIEDGDDPRWSPNGTSIAFARMGGDMGVYVVNADGSNLKRIADGAWPAWQPCPRIPVGVPSIQAPTQSNQVDLAVTDLYPNYGPQPQTVEGSPIGTVYVRIKNNGPSALTNVSVPLSCTSNLFGQTWTDSRSITKKGVIQLSLASGQAQEFNTGIFVNSAHGNWFQVTCSISFDNDPNPSNNVYSKNLP
jgi:Tol biopolymer transport system component